MEMPELPNEHVPVKQIIIAADPSGNFEHGLGHTGIAYMQIVDGAPDWDSAKVVSINAKNYTKRKDYWRAIIQEINSHIIGSKDIVVLERYVVRNNGFTIGKAPETAMLLGAILYQLPENVHVVEQTPAQAKHRYSDERLMYAFPKLQQISNKWYLNGKLTNEHCRDALRHLAYCVNYNM